MTVRGREISIQEVRIYSAVATAAARWLTSVEIAKDAQCARRTANAHALKFFKLGLFERAHVFPGYRYKIAHREDKRSADYLTLLKNATKVFGEVAFEANRAKGGAA